MKGGHGLSTTVQEVTFTDKHFTSDTFQRSCAVAFSRDLWLNWNTYKCERTELWAPCVRVCVCEMDDWLLKHRRVKTLSLHARLTARSRPSRHLNRPPTSVNPVFFFLREGERKIKKAKSHLAAKQAESGPSHFHHIHCFASSSRLLVHNNGLLGTWQALLASCDASGKKVREKKKNQDNQHICFKSCFCQPHISVSSGPLSTSKSGSHYITTTTPQYSRRKWMQIKNVQQKGRGKSSDADEEWCRYVSVEEMSFWLCSVLLLSSRGTLLARVRFIFLLIHEYWICIWSPPTTPSFFLFQPTPWERSRRLREDRRDGLDEDDNDADDAFGIFDSSPFFFLFFCKIAKFQSKECVNGGL